MTSLFIFGFLIAVAIHAGVAFGYYFQLNKLEADRIKLQRLAEGFNERQSVGYDAPPQQQQPQDVRFSSRLANASKQANGEDDDEDTYGYNFNRKSLPLHPPTPSQPSSQAQGFDSGDDDGEEVDRQE